MKVITPRVFFHTVYLQAHRLPHLLPETYGIHQ